MTTDPMMVGSTFNEPGSGRGLLDVVRRRYLLSLLIRKEVQIRYRGSALGWLWSYVKPLVQFLVFYVALGIFLGLSGSIEYYPIYLLAGITIVTFFNEAFSNGTRSLVDNAALIKKIYLPRELFPVASMFVAAINLRRRAPDHPRGYRAPMLVGMCGVGFAASLAALLVGFIPPSQFASGNSGLYFAIVGGGALGLGLVVPFIFYKLRKPSWKQTEPEGVSAS